MHPADRPHRRLGVVVAALLLGPMIMVSTACAGDDEPGPNQVTRIDGPATVDDDAGADEEGAPVAPGVAG